SDGNYLAAGKTPSWGAYVVKFNAEGEKLWSQSYPIRYRKIIELDNQDFLIIGMSSNNDNSSHNIVILRMDSVGNYLWHRYINFYNPDLFFTANYPTTVLQTSEQGFLIGGGTEYFTIGNDLLSLFLIKTDSLGNCHPYTNYNYTSDPIGTTVDFMNESWGADTYLWNFGDGTTSTVEQPSHTYDVAGQYMVCLKARNLCDSTTICQIVTAGQVVGIAENETNFAIQVLSNPVQDILTLQGSFAAQNETDLHIRLYHSNGSQVYISKLLLTNSTFQHQIPVSDLPSGVYFLQVQGEKSNVVQKVIVQ
ncbi:MAG: T9SS type A sorting domain-containing protein, partial [Chitinophagales bacterium]